MSTKSERGADEVIERIARCVRDAVDECDLDLKQVRGVGIGAPGAVDAGIGPRHFRPQPAMAGRAAEENPGKAIGRSGVRGERLQQRDAGRF